MYRFIKLFLCLAITVSSFPLFFGCTGTQAPPKGSRVVVLDNVSLNILHKLDIDVVGIPSSGWEDIDSKYADNSIYADVGIPMQPDYTKIALINPSEVIMSDATEKAFGNIKSSFEALNINVKLFNYNSVSELKNSIMELGEYFEKSQDAQNIVAELEEKEQPIKEQIQSMSNVPRVMVLFGAPLGNASQSISIAANGLFAGSIVPYTGAINVIDELYPNTNLGMIKPDNWSPILDLNPDYIFCVAHGNPDEVWAMYDSSWNSSPWNLLTAVREERIFYLPEDIAGVIASFNYVDTMQYILDIFNGEVENYNGGHKE